MLSWRTIVAFAVGIMPAIAFAHPFAATEYSTRTAFKASDEGLVAFVVLEVPIPVVMKGIGVAKEDDLDTKKRKVEKYNTSIWTEMAAGLTLKVDGQPVKGDWMPIEHELNGRAAEGFFVYMVGYAFKEPAALVARGAYTVTVDNVGWTDLPMWYSGSAVALEPWVVVENTAQVVLGEKQELNLNDPDRWTRDDRMRHMTVKVEKKPTP